MSYTPPRTDIIAANGVLTATLGATYYIDTSGGVGTITLQTIATTNEGDFVEIFDNGNANTNNITISRASTDTIESARDGVGQTSFVISENSGSVMLRSDGAGKWLAQYGGVGASGEANTASNLGAGEGVFAQKSGVDLQFKSLIAGQLTDLTSTANDIRIDTRWNVLAVQNANVTVAGGDYVPTDSSGGSFTVTLPAAATAVSGAMVEVKDSNNSSSGGNRVTIDGSGAETIDGDADVRLPRGGALLFVTDGSNWYIS